MKIIECDQRTPKWFDAKKGIVSATEIGAWIATPIWTPAMEGYADKLISTKLHQVAGCEDPPDAWPSWDMKRGNRLEAEAREAYTEITGNAVEQVGFVVHEFLPFGCSPDGFVNRRAKLVEIKAPRGSTQILYSFNADELPSEHKMQCHMQMAVCGVSELDFFCYCPPNVPPFLLTVKRDEFTERVLSGLIRLSARYAQRGELMHRRFKEYTEQTLARQDALALRSPQEDE